MKVRPGNHGILNYVYLDNSKVEIEFSPVTCNGQECSNTPQYFLIVANTLDNIYGQLNCAGNVLVSASQGTYQQNEIISIKPTSFDKDYQVFRHSLTLKENEEFIGVKAVVYDSNSQRFEALYTPTELSSIWNEVSKLSLSIFLLFSCVISLVLTVVIVISTKMARRGYRPISSEG